LLASMEWAMCFMTVVLPAFGGDTMRPRCPLPIGEQEVDDPRRHVLLLPRHLEMQPLVREERRQGPRTGALTGDLGVHARHGVDLDERRKLLGGAGGPAEASMASPLRRAKRRAWLIET